MWQRQSRQQRGLRYGTNNEGTYRLNVAIRTADHIIRSSATRTHCIASHHIVSYRGVVSSFRRRAGPQRTQPRWRQHRPQAKCMAHRQINSPCPAAHKYTTTSQASGRVGGRVEVGVSVRHRFTCSVRGWNICYRVILLSSGLLKLHHKIGQLC